MANDSRFPEASAATAEELMQSRWRSTETIRHHAGMYIGNVSVQGLHRMLFQLVHTSVRDAAAGFGRSVRVTLNLGGSATIADDGRGFPVAGSFTLEDAFTQAGLLRYDQLEYVVTNALSEWLEVETRYQGRAYHMEFQRGVPASALEAIGAASGSGLAVTFLRDPDIFETTQFDAGTIQDRLRECAFLNSGVRISFTNQVLGTEEHFEFADGMRAYVQWLNEHNHPLHPDVLTVRGASEGVHYEVGFQWSEEDEIMLRCYVNDEYMWEGGSLVKGFREGATRALHRFICQHMPDAKPLKSHAARRGVVGVVSVRMKDPVFVSARRSSVHSHEAERVIAAAVSDTAEHYFRANPTVAERIVSAALADMAAEEAFKKARRRNS
jgi:DNA gyrase subunit B